MNPFFICSLLLLALLCAGLSPCSASSAVGSSAVGSAAASPEALSNLSAAERVALLPPASALGGSHAVLIVVEVAAASHINLLLGGARGLLERGHRVDFAAADVYAPLVAAAEMGPGFSYMPLPTPAMSGTPLFAAFHRLYTSPHPGGEPAFLFERLFATTYLAVRDAVHLLLHQRRHLYSLVVIDMFSNAASDILRFDAFDTPYIPHSPDMSNLIHPSNIHHNKNALVSHTPPVVVSLPCGLGVFGFEHSAGLPSGLLPDTPVGDSSLLTRARDLAALARTVAATVGSVGGFNALRAPLGYPPLSAPTDVFAGRPVLSFMAWSLDWAARVAPATRLVGTPLNPHRPASAADAALLARLDALHAAGRPVLYLAFGSIAYPTPAQLRAVVLGALAASPALAVLAVVPAHTAEHALAALADAPPDRLLTAPWVNQRRVLEHPAVRAFLTHGGLMSVVEACAAAVPMLLLPFYGDQPGNALRVAHAGAGFVLAQHDPHLREAVASRLALLLEDPAYAQRAARLERHRAFVDPPRQFAAYLDEIIHFGPDHLFPVTDSLSLVAKYNLDIAAALLLTVLLILFTVFKILKALCCRK